LSIRTIRSKGGFICVPIEDCKAKCPANAVCAPNASGDCEIKCNDGFKFAASRSECDRDDACSAFRCPEYAVCSVAADGVGCEAHCLPGFEIVDDACRPREGFSPCDAYECPKGATCSAVDGVCMVDRATA
jgi:hypothetical protein